MHSDSEPANQQNQRTCKKTTLYLTQWEGHDAMGGACNGRGEGHAMGGACNGRGMQWEGGRACNGRGMQWEGHAM